MPKTPGVGSEERLATIGAAARHRTGGYGLDERGANDVLWLLAHIDSLVAERDGLREALERIADPDDPLEGIGSEQEFAQGVLDGWAP